MNDSSGQHASSATLAVDFLRRRRGALVRPRFLLFLFLVLLAHLCVLAFLLWQDWRLAREAPAVVEEIPVEVIAEPPPPPQQPPGPEAEKPPEEQKQQQKPPPPPPLEDEKPAFDAPEAESKTKSDVNAPEEKDLKTPKNAPEKDAPKDEKPQGMKDGEDEDAKAKAPEEAKEAPPDEKSDAEIIERAAPEAKPQEKPDPNEKGRVKKGEANSIADQLAALAPIPDYKLAAPRKFSPVGGGHAKTTYLTILYGMIMPHMRIPARVRGSGIIGRGAVVFYIDESGNLTHQALQQSSGAPDLDAAALAAVRRAAPFPPPPRGLPRSMLFSYATK